MLYAVLKQVAGPTRVLEERIVKGTNTRDQGSSGPILEYVHHHCFLHMQKLSHMVAEWTTSSCLTLS